MFAAVLIPPAQDGEMDKDTEGEGETGTSEDGGAAASSAVMVGSTLSVVSALFAMLL